MPYIIHKSELANDQIRINQIKKQGKQLVAVNNCIKQKTKQITYTNIQHKYTQSIT